MARQRYALLVVLCALLALAYQPAAGALVPGHRQVASYRIGVPHPAATRHGRCLGGVASGRRRGYARRANFHSSAGRRHGDQRRCPLGSQPPRMRRPASRRHRHRQVARHSSACDGADSTPTAANLELIRAATLCLVNRERTSAGESPLQLDAALARAAQGHSDDMAASDYFDHVGPGGNTPVDRMRASGYIYSSRLGYEVGENIAWGTLWLSTPRAIVAAWMASPGHRANILDGHYRDTAIGVAPHPLASLAHGQTGAIYTQDFGVIFAP